jgi:hypothetical protein
VLVTHFGRVAVAQQDEAPAPGHQLALAVLTLLDDGRHVAREDDRHRLEGGSAVMRDAEEPRNGITLLLREYRFHIRDAQSLPPGTLPSGQRLAS